MSDETVGVGVNLDAGVGGLTFSSKQETLIDFGNPPDRRGRLTQRDLDEVDGWDVTDGSMVLQDVRLRFLGDDIGLQWASKPCTWNTFKLAPLCFRPSPVGGKWMQWPEVE